MPRKSDAPPKPKSIYHLFVESDGGGLNPLGQFEGRNAEDAVSTYLRETGTEANGQPFVIVPDRNLSRVRVEVQTVQKVKLSAVS